MVYVQLDPGTKSEIQRLYAKESMPIEEIAEEFGIPESLVAKVLLNRC